MLMLVIALLIVSIILGIFSFTGKGNNLKQTLKVFFFIFLILFLVALGWYLMQFYRVQADVHVKMPSAGDWVPNPFK